MGRKRKGRRVDKSLVMGSLVRVYTNEGRYPIIEGRFRAAVFLTIAEVIGRPMHGVSQMRIISALSYSSNNE